MRDRAQWKRLLLATAGAAALAVPIFADALMAPRLRAQASATQSPANAAPAAQSLEAMEAAGIKMEFDVASVKPNKSSDLQRYANLPLGGDAYVPTGGLFSAKNIPLLLYMAFAYNLTAQSKLFGLPDWVNNDRFDIEARAANSNPTKDQMRLMMQSLLADRFKLALHRETRQSPVYALVLSKEGKTGPQLQPHVDDGSCSTTNTTPASGTKPPAPPSPPSSTSGLQLPPIVCGSAFGLFPASAPGRVRYGARSMDMAAIATSDIFTPAASGLDRPIVDKTGLTGKYDFVIEWTFQPPGVAPQQLDLPGPTFLEALKDQLGLKVESQTGPVDVLVIDHVEPPSPN
jgi:uncharacterized protein (TIGR03435 family)